MLVVIEIRCYADLPLSYPVPDTHLNDDMADLCIVDLADPTTGGIKAEYEVSIIPTTLVYSHKTCRKVCC